MDKLKKCPFCGGKARMEKKLFDTESVVTMRFRAVCMECGSNNDWYTDKGYAIKAWNTRKPIERIVERLEDNSFRTEPTYDMDGYSNEDETEVINLQKAIQIVKEEM